MTPATLASFKLRIADRHARLVYTDGRCADVEGDALERMLAAARPLVEHVERLGGGRLRAVSVSLGDRVLRATFDGAAGDAVRAVRVDGERFEREVAPLCEPLRFRATW